MTEELKPCPFCGGDARTAALSEFEGIDGRRIVSVHSGVPRFCPNCGARVAEAGD